MNKYLIPREMQEKTKIIYKTICIRQLRLKKSNNYIFISFLGNRLISTIV